MDKFAKPYDPKTTEPEIYKQWLANGFFNPDNLPIEKDAKTFTIALPPPNVTGVLHMGHALNVTAQDILIRKKRMEGFRTLWIPGTDHAGIATQNVVEKDLKKQGLNRHDLGREKFLEKVWEWKEKYGDIILDQLKTLGASCDWSRTAFTMDDNYKKAVETAFKHYYEKGLIYQGERVINWCARCATSLSDLELEYKEEKGTLYYIKYPLKNDPVAFVVIATTRPETMLGDTGVAVHPNDTRYASLVGKTLMLPILNREIPIVADNAIDMAFGTGAVKVTPAHSIADFEIGERHKLPLVKIISDRGKMTSETGAYEGLNIEDCRVKVVETLKSAGLLEKEESLVHNVAHCYRCDKVIEQILSKQWFVKMDGLAKKAADAVRSGAISFYPKNFEKPYLDWLENTKDWCISRQIWWGHKIPLEGVDDVLDTWFSSALWPLATLGWPKKTPDLQKFYPTQALFTGRDIINLWVSRMIFSGLELMDGIPFKDVYINPTVQAKDGKRMSKSLGTGIDPLVLIEKYGADATRFGLIWQTMGVQDMRFSEEHLLAGKKFANKLWNITRFVLTKTDGAPDCSLDAQTITGTQEKAILEKLAAATASVSADIDAFRFGQALHTLYDFVWHDFADAYIEQSKAKDAEEVKHVLSYVLAQILKLLHPFMPFITEEIYGSLGNPDKKQLLIEAWPKTGASL